MRHTPQGNLGQHLFLITALIYLFSAGPLFGQAGTAPRLGEARQIDGMPFDRPLSEAFCLVEENTLEPIDAGVCPSSQASLATYQKCSGLDWFSRPDKIFENLVEDNADLNRRAAVLACAVGLGKLAVDDAYTSRIQRVLPTIFSGDDRIFIDFVGINPRQLGSVGLATFNGRGALAEATGPNRISLKVPNLGDERIELVEIEVYLSAELNRPAASVTFSEGLVYAPLPGVAVPAESFISVLADSPVLSSIAIFAITVVLTLSAMLTRAYVSSRSRLAIIDTLEMRLADTERELSLQREVARPLSASLDDDSNGFEEMEEEPSTLTALEPQHPPQELIDAIANGAVVGFNGLGLSISAGLPSYRDLFLMLIEEAERDGLTDHRNARSLKLAIDQGRWLSVADWIVTTWRDNDLTLARSINTAYAKRNATPSKAMHQLSKLRLPLVMTWATDTVFDQVYHGRVLVSSEAERALDRLSRRDPTYLKLYGDVDHPADLTVSTRQFEAYLAGNEALEDLLSRVYYSRTLLFLGVSLGGLEDLLASFPIRSVTSQKHYALVGVSGDDWRIVADGLRSRYGVEVIPLDERQINSEVERILGEIEAAVQTATVTKPPPEAQPGTVGQTLLSSVSLKNIGPFEKLTMEFDETWNLFLGDNGVGKSTVLKAIALAFAGDQAETEARRLIRSGATSAEITLRTKAGAEYQTFLKRRSGGGVEIDTRPSPPLETENWLAIGFPALRTTTWRRPGFDLGMGAARPTRDDVLPILSDEPDPRLDGLKQRIVTLDHLNKTSQLQGEIENRHQNLLSDLFEIFDTVTEGLDIAFEEINPETRAIRVRINDVVLPLEAMSQGTISLISWVGVILQRFYEVAPPKQEDPRKMRALVLIDEIDAHMHPAWQATVLADLKSIFKNTQFIATTHSPLVIRGLASNQVFRFRRSAGGGAEVIPMPENATMGRPDQILSGEAFQVDPQLDEITQTMRDRYEILLGKPELDADEADELGELSEKLAYRIPNTYTRADDRRAMDLVTSLMEAQAFGIEDNVKGDLLEKARNLLNAAEREID